MRTEDHLVYARRMVDHLKISRPKRLAFKLGCIMPDYNKFTYLGHHVRDFSQGHSYRARKREIAVFFHRPYRGTLIWWYRAGLRIHYLGDSFSRPHQPEFNYKSKPHVSYEWELHDLMAEFLHGPGKWTAAHVSKPLHLWLEERHETYMKETRGQEDDSYYIETTLMGVWHWVEMHKLPPELLPPELQAERRRADQKRKTAPKKTAPSGAKAGQMQKKKRKMVQNKEKVN